MLSRGRFNIALECPDCHPKLKVCFCDSTLTDGCSLPEDFSVEVGEVTPAERIVFSSGHASFEYTLSDQTSLHDTPASSFFKLPPT